MCAALAMGRGPAAADDTSVGRVGVATAVNAMAEGQPPQRPSRPLVVGLDIEQGERIDTDASGRAQLLFLDGSSITIGNHASVVIDDFVFDPTSRKGHLGLAMGRGLMRFIGGHLSKDGSVDVRTPTALLGIRGAIVLIEVAPDGSSTTATLLFGDKVTVTGVSGAVEVIRRIGESSTVRRDGVPTVPRRVGPEQIKPLDQALEARAAGPGSQSTVIGFGTTMGASGPAQTSGMGDSSPGADVQSEARKAPATSVTISSAAASPASGNPGGMATSVDSPAAASGGTSHSAANAFQTVTPSATVLVPTSSQSIVTGIVAVGSAGDSPTLAQPPTAAALPLGAAGIPFSVSQPVLATASMPQPSTPAMPLGAGLGLDDPRAGAGPIGVGTVAVFGLTAKTPAQVRPPPHTAP